MIRRTNVLVLGLLSLLFVIPASKARPKDVTVSDIDGNELLRLCTSPDGTSEEEFCGGFINGVRDGVALATELRRAKAILEMPVQVKQDQLRDIVVKYLKEHPESRRFSGANPSFQCEYTRRRS